MVLEKIVRTIFYFNYLIFGPFLFCSLLTLNYQDKLKYVCIKNNPEKKVRNFGYTFIFIFGIIFSFVISFFGLFVFEDNYFNNSIKLKPSGNYIIGIIFWFRALKRSRRFGNQINENNIDEIILDDSQNNQNNKD